ncbi:MAG: hypothetical protein K2H85_09840, partial [Allobaculum sp.]|nr:hypothetical protein [Allobaculum sp.]
MGNLYDYDSSAFNKDILDDLAKAANYNNYSNMLDAVVNAAEGSIVNKASDFGEITFNFGRANGAGAALEWMPVALSKQSGTGDAILTLWLSNSTEKSTFTDGENAAPEAGSIPSANMYSSSYIHALINSGQTSTGYFAAGYSGNSNPTMTPNSNNASISNYNTFSEFVTGIFSDLVAVPSSIGWQMSESDNKNDPAYSDTYYTNQVSVTGHYDYYGWTNDNLWLPSITETGNGAGDNIGIWSTTANMRKNTGGVNTYVRSGLSSLAFVYALDYSSGVGLNQYFTFDNAVRPAFHLNLSKLGYTVNNVEVTYNGSVRDIEASEIAAADKKWYDSDAMT